MTGLAQAVSLRQEDPAIRPKPEQTLIIFDLDGTLVEFPFEHLFSTAEALLETLEHPPVCRTLIERCFANHDFFRFVDEPLRRRFAEELNQAFNKQPFPPAVPFGAAKESLESLKNAGYTLALATARSEQPERLAEQLAHTGFVEYFSCIASRSDHSTDWSDKTEQLRGICRKLGFSPTGGIMVGDIPSDIANARAVGIGITAALTSGGTSREVLLRSRPDLLFDRIEEVAEYVLNY